MNSHRSDAEKESKKTGIKEFIERNEIINNCLK